MDITNKYHNGKIYKITDISYNKSYIGSTTEELSQRMARHRQGFKRFLNDNKNYLRAYDLFNEYGIENCKIELFEYFKCDTFQELRRKEGEHIKNTECVNKYVAGRTQKEYKQDNKDKIQIYNKEYAEQNKDKIKEYNNANKDKIREQKKRISQSK
jgi:hypothetical protein